jgi:thioredoxin-related protein
MKFMIWKYTVLGLCSSLIIQAQTKTIQFNSGNFKTLLETAKKENKLIFIDAYTTWCGPCKNMAKNVFTQDKVADYYNANFINAKIDMEKGEGIALAQQYSVNCYPNLLYIDGNGNVVHRTAGFHKAEDFITLGQTAKEGKETFPVKRAAFEKEGITSANITPFLELIQSTCLDASSSLDGYFSALSEDELLEPVNWNLIRDERQDYQSRELQYVFKMHKAFEAKYPVQEVQTKIVTASLGFFNPELNQQPIPMDAINSKKEAFKKQGFPYFERTLWEVDLLIAKKSNDTKTFHDLLVKGLMQYSGNDSKRLNKYAWEFFEKSNDKVHLTKAEEWAKQSINVEDRYDNLDTYANLLYKNGKTKEAEEWAKKAIDKANKDGLSKDMFSDTQKLLDKIRSGKN